MMWLQLNVYIYMQTAVVFSSQKLFFFLVKPPHPPQPTVLGLWSPYVYPTVRFVSDFTLLCLSCPHKMASIWLGHHHIAAILSYPRRYVLSYMRHVGLTALLILASFCCVVSWREARLSWWPPHWVDSDEESSIKVSGIERFYGSGGVCVGVCVVVVMVFTSLETPPT